MGRDRDDNGFGDWGGYMEAKISKLEEQFAQSSDPFRKTNLFAGISIYVNGLTNPSSDELKRIMMTNGGVYHHYERKHTTYIIASNLPDVKIRNMDTSKIISPQWILDCLKEERILDYTNYLLYTNRKKSQPELKFFKKKINEDRLTENGSIEENVQSFTDSASKKNVSDEEEMSLNLKLSAVETDEFVNLTFSGNEIGTDLPDKTSKKIDENEQKVDDNFEINQIIRDLDILNAKIRLEGFKSTCNETLTKPQNISLQNSMNSHGNTSGPARTANDPKFLSEFYNNSRLHHIATLGASFKQYITELRDENKSMDFPNRKILKEKLLRKENCTWPSCVMHIDMDCFFVSVGLKKYPHLRGKPVAVTHSKGGGETVDRPGVDRQLEKDLYMKRLETKLHENINGDKTDKIKNGFDSKESLSEIASCSYEARKMGIKNGMFVGQALKLCPQLKTIPYEFDGYKEVATSLYNIIAQYTLNIEAVSCDEMFVDLTELINDVKIEPMDFVKFVRDEVKTKTGCPCSAGVGANRLQARMATKKAKPDGQYFLDPETVEEYMSEIPIKELPGVGYSTSHTLKQKNLFTCGDLQKVTLAKIQCEIGKKFGETLYQFCRGIDNKPLVYGQIRKSVSAEVNYGIRFKDTTEMETFLKQLCGEVHSRLMETKRKGKCLTLKIMTRAKEAPLETAKFMGHGYCDQQSKSVTLSAFTDSLETITRTILATMKSLCIEPSELRGIGIQISKLEDLNDGKSSKNDCTLIKMFNKLIDKQKEKIELEMPKLRNSQGDKTSHPTYNAYKAVGAGPLKLKLKRTVSEAKLKAAEAKKMCLRSAKPNDKSDANATKPAKKSVVAKPIKQNLKTMFAKIESKKARCLQNGNIDLRVFAQLPSDIQKEILREKQGSFGGYFHNQFEDAPDESTPGTSMEDESMGEESLAVASLADDNMSEAEEYAPDKNLLNENSSEISLKKVKNKRLEADQLPGSSTLQTRKSQLKNDADNKVVKILYKRDAKKIPVKPVLENETLDSLEEAFSEKAVSEKAFSETSIFEKPILERSYSENSILRPTKNLKKIEKKINSYLHKESLEKDNIFMERNFPDIIREWIAKSPKPTKIERDFLCRSAEALIVGRKLCYIYLPIIQFLEVVTASKLCEWHLVYKKVKKCLQAAMLSTYGTPMLLNETVHCDFC